MSHFNSDILKNPPTPPPGFQNSQNKLGDVCFSTPPPKLGIFTKFLRFMPPLNKNKPVFITKKENSFYLPNSPF